MMRKIFYCFLFLLPIFLLAFPKKVSFSQSDDKPSIKISSYGNYSEGGLISLSSIAEPKIDIRAYQTSGSAKIEIYSVALDDILNYLVHDNNYHQINPKVDVGKFVHLTDINVNLNQETNTISLPLASNGLFYVKAIQGDITTGSFIARSTIGSMAREAKSSLVVWTQDFTTQRSSSGAAITLYNLEKGKNKLAQVSSDNDGIASIPLTTSADLVVVQNNDSTAILPLNAKYLNSNYTWTTFTPNIVSKKYFVFTDRPVYQPGDKVNFKAIVRDDDDARYSIGQGSVLVGIGQGYENNSFIYKNNFQIDTNGFISGSYTLPKNVTTGEYRIVINPKTITGTWGSYPGNDDSIYFRVENYRKPEYFIEAKTPKMEVVRGDDIDVTLNGEFYSGQPLANTTVNYKIYSDPSAYYGDYEYYYPDTQAYYRGWNGAEIDSGTLTLDKKGKGDISISTTTNDSQGKYQVYFVEFTYADASGNQTLTGVNVLVRSGEYSLYRNESGPYGGKTGQKISLPLTLFANRSGVSLSQKVDIEVIRHWWEKYTDSNSKYPLSREVKDNIGNYKLTTDKSGKAIFDFTPQKEGSYELKTTMTDSRGNVVNKSFYLWVSDKYANYYQNDYRSTITLTTDKKTYKIGDKAIVSVHSDIPNRDIYLGVEREYQDRYQILHLNGNSIDTQIDITDHDLPNIFLAAKSFNSTELEGDIQSVSVDTTGKKIIYTISTDKKDYAPGDEVTVNVSAKDTSGNPVESNLALWAVDKSIFALADPNYGDVFENFWQTRGDDTQSSHSLEGIYISSSAEKGGCFLAGTKVLMSDKSEKSIEDVKVGDKILTRLSPKSSKMVETKVSATHHVSAAGYLVINNALSLTDNHLLLVNGKWTTARSIKIGDELIGINDQKIKVFSIEYLNLPSQVYNLTTDTYHSYFANGVYVHNDKGGGPRDNFADTAYWNASINTNSQGQAQVKFKLPDNLTTWVISTIGASSDTKAGQGSAEIKVSKDLVIRPVLPNVLNEKDLITVSAIINNYTDLDSKSTVRLKTDAGEILSSNSQKITVSPNDFAQVSWQIKVGSNPSSKFEFSVSDDRGRSDTVIQNIESRSLGYWDQKSDFKNGSALFGLKTSTANYDLNKSTIEVNLSPTMFGSLPSAMKYLINYPYGCTEQTSSSLIAKLIAQKYPSVFSDALKNSSKKQTIEDGLARLKQLQNYDGSWSWWWQGGQSEPFVTAYVFRILNEAKSQSIAVDESMYLKAQDYLTNNFDTSDIENQVIKAYGLSFALDSKLHRSVDLSTSSLSDDYVAMAVYANLASGVSDPSRSGLNLLLTRMQSSDSSVHWQAGDLARFGSSEASTALAIQALVKSSGHQVEASKAINYLMKNRSHDYWDSTYTTAQTMIAITDYSAAANDSSPNFSYRLLSGSTVLASGKFSGANSVPVTLKLDLKKISKSGDLRIEKDGVGELYSTVNQKLWIKDVDSVAVSNGVKITKTIINNKGEDYNFVPGDLVKVSLEISFLNSDLGSGYAVIEDHLPSGLIPVNTNLKNESSEPDPDYLEKEFLADGVIIPISYSSTRQVYSYMARVINSGTFAMPGAYYSLMYSPENWARSESSTFVVDDTVKVSPLVKLKEMAVSLSSSKNHKLYIVYAVGLLVLILISVLVYKHVKKSKNKDIPNP